MNWYAVYVLAKHEFSVRDCLQRKELSTFLPLQYRRSRRTDRKKILQLPLFPNYLFVRTEMSKNDYVKILNTLGVVRLLGNGFGDLWPVSDEEIESVEKVVQNQELFTFQLVDYIQSGDKVRIAAGPLAGVVGTLVDKNMKKCQLSVSLSIMNRSLVIAVNTGVVERVV